MACGERARTKRMLIMAAPTSRTATVVRVTMKRRHQLKQKHQQTARSPHVDGRSER